MKMRSFVTALSLSVGLSALVLPGVAGASVFDSHILSVQEVQSIHTGESLDAVIQRLGKPDNITNWPDGSRSAVYDASDSLVGRQRVYVYLNADNTVRSVDTNPLY